jgi:multidrug resistance efflux pump
MPQLQTPPKSQAPLTKTHLATVKSPPPNLPKHLPSLVQTPLLERIFVAALTLGLGSLAIAAAVLTVRARVSYLTIDTAIVNAPVTELQSPLDGTLMDVSAQPGKLVKVGDLLAKIKPIATEETLLSKLQGEIDVLTAQSTQVGETQALLTSQLQSLDQQDNQVAAQQNQMLLQQRSIDQAKVNAATVELEQQRAAITSTTAKAFAAKTEADRYATLAQEGVLSRQKADQVKTVWQAAEAEVLQARAALKAAEARLATVGAERPLGPPATTIEQRLSLKRNLQEQTSKLQTLTAEIATKRVQLKVQQTQQKTRSQSQSLKAPTNGIIYRTLESNGAQVSRTKPLLNIADCSNRWVEALVLSRDAAKIDRTQPVQVILPGQSQPLIGEIESLAGMNLEEVKRLPQAVSPIPPTQLAAQIPTRIVVKVANIPDGQQNMCGIGQTAQLKFVNH